MEVFQRVTRPHHEKSAGLCVGFISVHNLTEKLDMFGVLNNEQPALRTSSKRRICHGIIQYVISTSCDHPLRPLAFQKVYYKYHRLGAHVVHFRIAPNATHPLKPSVNCTFRDAHFRALR